MSQILRHGRAHLFAHTVATSLDAQSSAGIFGSTWFTLSISACAA